MRPAHKLLGSILVLVLVTVIAGVAILVDATWLVGFIERRIATDTGREAHIGNIEFRIGRCLHLATEDVRITNPTWAKTPALIDSRRLSGCVAWLPLLMGRLDLEEARVEATHMGLEREGNRVTWAMDEKESEGPSRIRARHITVINSSVYFRDRDKKTEMNIDISGGVGEGDELRLQAKGSVRDAPIQIVASTPAQPPSEESPTRVSAKVVLGRTTAIAVGNFRQLGLEGVEIQLTMAGDDLSDLNRLGINLPPTPPYKLHGRLAFSDNTWNFNPFGGRIGDSDINGELTYSIREPRPLLRADVYAQLLDFDDLGPLVGAPPKTKAGETASPQQKAQAQQVVARKRVLPTNPLGIEKWPRMDADVRFRADRVRRPNAVPVNGLSAHLRIDDAKLRLQPLDFEIAGGRIKSNIVIEGKTEPPRGSLSADIENLELARMFPKLDQQRAAAGKLFGRVKLEASGNSIAKLAGSSNGEVTLMVNGGHISALLLELAGLDAGEALAILVSRGDRPVSLRCAIADFNLNSGLATSEIAVIDTDDTVFTLSGTVSLDNEQLNLKVIPQPKDQSMPVVRTPLVIGGYFIDPSVRPQAGPLLARGGVAVALGLVNPLLALIPLVETGPGKNSDCAAFARLARGEGVETQKQTPDDQSSKGAH